MSCPRHLRPWLSAAVVSLALPAIAAPWRGDRLDDCEPGFPAADGSWILPLTTGDDDRFEVCVDGGAWTAPQIFKYAPAAGGRPVAAIVLFDALLSADGQPVSPAPWERPLRRLLTDPGLLIAGGRCTAATPKIPRPGTAGRDLWPAVESERPERATRLWDGVLEALTVLSELEEPDRRLLVLVSDGREEVASEHVSASCLDAAARARIPIYVLWVAAGADPEADAARLRDLAVRSGGQFVADDGGTTGDGAEGAVGDLCGRIAAVRGLQLDATGDGLPVTATVRRVGRTDGEMRGTIAARQPLRAPGTRRWYVLGVGFLATIGAGAVLWRQRNAAVGELILTTGSGVRHVSIPRDGLTIGSDRGNRLRLENRTISGHHAVIHRREGHLVLTDLRSTRGTTVNGQPVVAHRLVSGDRILLGREVELLYRKARSRGTAARDDQ